MWHKVTYPYTSLFYVGKIDDSERLRPEELNQQNIEALVAESNLVSNHLTNLFLFVVNIVDIRIWKNISLYLYIYLFFMLFPYFPFCLHFKREIRACIKNMLNISKFLFFQLFQSFHLFYRRVLHYVARILVEIFKG